MIEGGNVGEGVKVYFMKLAKVNWKGGGFLECGRGKKFVVELFMNKAHQTKWDDREVL